MKEIKFRAFDLKTKEIKQVDSIYFYNQEDEDGNLGEVSLVGEEITKYYGNGNLKQVEIMQFTGLCDKNGKEIYEGDILKITYTSHETLIKVIFKEGTFVGLKTKSNCNCVALLSKYDLKNFEIIGNIYENIFLNDKFEQDTNKIIFD